MDDKSILPSSSFNALLSINFGKKKVLYINNLKAVVPSLPPYIFKLLKAFRINITIHEKKFDQVCIIHSQN